LEKDKFRKMSMEEQELVQRLKEGDEMAFAEIVRRYKDKIVNFLWQLTGDYQKAVELSQETFMRVYFKAHKYKPIAPFSSWIYAIASNLAKTELKKMRKVQTIPLDVIQHKIPEESSYHRETESDIAKAIKKALSALPPRYRIPVVLKDIEGFSQEEIALMLKRPLGTIKARISRGRRYLRKELEKSSLKIHLLLRKKEKEYGRV
jgi:RNA polymerase sigma-70 factor (ECF subfamily)